MLPDLDYSTFVLLPGTKNPSAGMMMLSKQGETVVLDERTAALESSSYVEKTDEPNSPTLHSEDDMSPFARICRNGSACAVPMCTFAHPRNFSGRPGAPVTNPNSMSRLSYSSAPFIPTFTLPNSPMKPRQEKFQYDAFSFQPLTVAPRSPSMESKAFDLFCLPSSRTSSTSSRLSTSSTSPERSPELVSRTLFQNQDRRFSYSRKGPHYDKSDSYGGEFARPVPPIVLYANAN
jgi:hypothetical protein